MAQCIFCQIVAGDIPSDIVYEDDAVVAFNDIAPQAPVHVLIIPRAHIVNANELSEANAAIVGRLALRARALARERGIDELGYRLVMNCNDQGGQTVYHLHMHLLGGRQLRALG